MKSLNEQQNVRTAPIKTEILLKVIKYTINNNSGNWDFENLDDTFMRMLENNLKLVGMSPKFNILDYIFAFIKENADLIQAGNFKESEFYVVPKKKKFKWTGQEVYNARKGDTYSSTEEMYSKEFLETALYNNEIEVWSGKLGDEEIYETWDTEVTILDIEEIPFNSTQTEIPFNSTQTESVVKELKNLQEILGKK